MKKMFVRAPQLCVLLLMAVCALSLNACLKDDNNYSVQAAGVALINAAPGSEVLDFYSENSRKPLSKPFAYDSVLTYNGAYPGFRVFGVTLHNSLQVLGSRQFSLEPGVAYSLFVTDTIGDIKLEMLRDSLSDQDSTQATVRFTNMSANAPHLSLEISGKESLDLSDIAYAKATDFKSLAPGDSYSLKLINSDTHEVLATKSAISFEKEKIYTIWAKGVFESTDKDLKMGLGIMEN